MSTIDKKEESDWSDNITREEEEAILEGLKQEFEGRVKSHDQILEKHRKQFPHLELSLLKF